MTTTTLPTYADAGHESPPPRPPVSVLSTRFAAVAMVAGPLAFLGAALVDVPFGGETIDGLRALRGHRGSAIAYVDLFVAAQGFLAFAWLRMGGIVAAGSRRLGLIGGTLLAFAMTVMAVYNGMILTIGYVAQGTDVEQLVAPIDDLFAHPNTGSLSPFLIVIGSLCLAIGALRSKVLPRFQAIAIGLFAFVPVGLMANVRPALLAAAAASIVALVPTGLRGLRAGAN